MSHPDYDKNLKDALNWITHQEKKIPEGMTIAMGGNDNQRKSLLWFSCRGKYNYAHPISLHQGNDSFRREIKRIHAIYFKLSTENVLNKIEQVG